MSFGKGQAMRVTSSSRSRTPQKPPAPASGAVKGPQGAGPGRGGQLDQAGLTTLVGYARVSTPDQSANLKTEALKPAKAGAIFEKMVSGLQPTRPNSRRQSITCAKATRLSCGSS